MKRNEIYLIAQQKYYLRKLNDNAINVQKNQCAIHEDEELTF